MSLLQGDPLPNIDTTKVVDTTGPDWYTTYLEGLAEPGTKLMEKTGEELVAPMSDLQTGVLDYAKGPEGTGTGLSGYETMLGDAGDTATLAAAGITPEMIQGFLNPYISGYTNDQGVKMPGVVDEMERLQQQSLQRSLIPSLKGAFAGTGGMGGKRMFDAMGQMGADTQANLLGAQTKQMASGYDSALKAAMDQSGLYRNAAETQRNLATSELDLKLKELERLYNLGGEEQKLEQSGIMAPLAAATGAANVFSNVKVPSTVSEKASAPIPGAYSTSPLAQIAGLGSLFASGPNGGTSAASGFADAASKLGSSLSNLFSNSNSLVNFGGSGSGTFGEGDY
tara:strand:- start:3943 stop:4959 length:1017 start_codon:yes stop_codon:yes gene_type:complete